MQPEIDAFNEAIAKREATHAAYRVRQKNRLENRSKLAQMRSAVRKMQDDGASHDEVEKYLATAGFDYADIRWLNSVETPYEPIPRKGR